MNESPNKKRGRDDVEIRVPAALVLKIFIATLSAAALLIFAATRGVI